MSLLTFTPKKFATLLLAAVIFAFATTNRTPAPHRSTQLDLFGLQPATQAVGQDNGSLTSNYYLDASYTATPVTRTPDRHTVLSEPLAPTPQAPPVRRNYPPLAH